MSIPACLTRFLTWAIQRWTLQPAGAFPFPASGFNPPADPGNPSLRRSSSLRYANTGGPRSRVVSTAVVSRLLSEGSETLGLHPLGDYQLPRHPANKLRELAFALLRRAGFLTPEEAWEVHAREVPGGVALVVECPRGPDSGDPGEDPVQQLRTALVLGKCSGSLYSPHRPLIWSERRLARSVRLVHCEAETFTHSDDE